MVSEPSAEPVKRSGRLLKIRWFHSSSRPLVFSFALMCGCFRLSIRRLPVKRLCPKVTSIPLIDTNDLGLLA